MMGTVEDTYDVRGGEGRYHLSCLILYYPTYGSPVPEFLLRREGMKGERKNQDR